MTPAVVLLDALKAFLDQDVQSQLTAYSAYQNRIASNLLGVLAREADLGSHLQALDETFARENDIELGDLPGNISRALRDGTVDDGEPFRIYLQRRSLLALAIDNPRYSGYRQARERWPNIAAELDVLITDNEHENS